MIIFCFQILYFWNISDDEPHKASADIAGLSSTAELCPVCTTTDVYM